MTSWRDRVDPLLKNHLDHVINDTGRHRNSYKISKSPGNAQLWLALASLSKQIFELNLKLNYLERALKDVSLQGSKPKQEKKTKSSKKKKSTKKALSKF